MRPRRSLRQILNKFPYLQLFRSSEYKGEFDKIKERERFNEVAKRWRNEDLEGK